MARISPGEEFDLLKDRVHTVIKNVFPIVGKKQGLHLEDLHIKDDPKTHGIDNLRAQKQAKLMGRDWAVPVEATLSLKDNETGKVVDKQKIRLLNLPKITTRYSNIVGGNEYQIDNQWRLKSGVYARIRNNGQLESQFNLAKGRGFDLTFDPEKKKFLMEYGTSKIPLYPLMREMGIPHEHIEKTWGKAIADANRSDSQQAILKFYKAATGNKPANYDQAQTHFLQTMAETRLRPDTTRLTLGEEHHSVTGKTLLQAATKVLHISQGKAKPDARDSLEFKELHSAEDFMGERIQKSGIEIHRRVRNNLDRRSQIRDIIGSDIFGRPVRTMFTKSSLSNIPDQTNPLEIFSNQMKTTIMGEGGIKSAHGVDINAKLVDPSHLGYLDGIQTPEGQATGVTLRLALGVKKVGHDVAVQAYNLKTGKYEAITPEQAVKHNLVLPDQVRWKGNKPVPTGKIVRMSGPRNEIIEAPFREGDYVLRHSHQLFGMSSNLVPFLPTDSPNRSTMAGRHMEQAVSLKHREPPLVRSIAGNMSFEKMMGASGLAAHNSPIDGVVTATHADAIHIKGKDGKQEVQIYHNFPLNADKNFLHSTPTVKVGDTVKKGQTLADTNFSRDGVLAMGTNLRVGYFPYKGLNYEDGVVISESAAKKLTCFDYNTEILTARGWLTRRQLKKSDLVAALALGELVYQPILKIHDFESNQMVVGSSRQFDIRVTPTHQLYVSPSKKDEFKKIEARQLFGKRVRLLRTATTHLPDQPYFLLPSIEKDNNHGPQFVPRIVPSRKVPMDDWCLLFGLYIAEGHCDTSGGNKKCPKVFIRQCKPRVRKVLRDISERLGFGKLCSSERWIWSSKQAVLYLQQFGHATDKYLPDWVWSLSQRQARLLLKGLMLGDGCFSMQKLGSYFTSSVRLRDDVQRLALHCGYSANWSIHNLAGYKTKMKDGRIIRSSTDSYRISILGPEHKPHVNTTGAKLRIERLKTPIPVWCVTVPAGVVYVRRNGKPRWCGNSEHLHRKSVDLEGNHILSRAKYQAYVPHNLPRDQFERLDAEGVIKPGTTVKPGDMLIAALQHRVERADDHQLAKLHRSLVKPYKDVSVKWDKDFPGVVTEVVKRGKQIAVHVRTEEPMEVGDKISARHGNKGIVTRILPDHEMPHTANGNPMELLLNPITIPGRTNLGQVLETAAAKIAEKTGKPYLVRNFEGVDLHKKVSDDLKAHGLTDKEMVFDPKTKRPLGEALVGPQYIFKLKHQVEKKMLSRAGGPGYAYDVNGAPKGGGPHGAQSLGALGLYAALAHGATHNLREMNSYKSDAKQQDDFWAALQAGEQLPPPRPSFAYTKFGEYMRTLGVNMKKTGNTLQLVPFTDKHILEMSNGEIKDPGRMVRAKDLKPEKGGLFDPDVTGGVDGTKWSHISIPEPMPNPLFEKSIQFLTGLRQTDYHSLVNCEKSLDPKTGKIVDTMHGLTGGLAIKHLLRQIDVPKELAAAQKELKSPGLKDNRLDRVNKKVKFLRALEAHGLTPVQAYMTNHIPVLPPAMRPVSLLPNGDLNTDDLNHHYKALGETISQWNRMSKLVPDEEKHELRAAVYDGMKSLAGMGGHTNRETRGVLDIIQGKTVEKETGQKIGSPKLGFFQKKMIARKQDLTMRSTIVPEPEMGLDEVGIPRTAAMELYKPFVVREIRASTGMSPLQAQQAIKKDDPLAHRALEKVVTERPVLLKRDPVLHKYGIQAFKPMLIEGKAIKIHPLVTSGFNADFDGDMMSAFVPVTREAVDEAHQMYPSRNLFNPATGAIMYAPTHEAKLGLYGLSKADRPGKSYKTFADLQTALDKGETHFNSLVSVGGLKAPVGRFLIAAALPEKIRGDFLRSKEPFTGKAQDQLLTRISKEFPNDFGVVTNKLKDLGNKWSTQTVFSIGLDDIRPEYDLQKKILAKADHELAAHADLPEQQFNEKAVQIYGKATKEMHKHLEGLPEDQHKLLFMGKAGVKPGIDTLRQIKVAPMLMMNAKGETIPSPVRHAYSQGLDVADYWTSMSGARKGIIQKVQEVSEPGYVTKQVVNSVMNNTIINDDCGTDKGISLSTDDKDILDRYLAAPLKVGKTTYPVGTLVTPNLRTEMRNNKVGLVVVRSPLKCLHGPGVCKKCYGLMAEGHPPEVGTNVGILAAQAVGERAAQLSMRTFHTGGTASTKMAITDEFQRVKDLLRFPKKLPNSATLSEIEGKVESITKDPAGGHNVMIGGVRHYVPQNLGSPAHNGKALVKGAIVKKGDPIAEGPINPHEMLPLTGIEKVQGYLTNELHGMYAEHGIRRRNIEMLIKGITNLSKIHDAGDHPHYIRGDFAPTTELARLNRQELKGKKPIQYEPVLKGVDVLPLEMQEDFMAKLNHEELAKTITEAAQEGWKSSIHGTHPIPGLAYGAEFGKGKPGEY